MTASGPYGRRGAEGAGPGRPDGPEGSSFEAKVAQALGVMTVATGANLMVTPCLVLRLLGAKDREPSPYLLQVVGMFIAASGGLMVDGARRRSHVALRWSFGQKLAIALAIVLGVRSGRLGRQALGVAAFDGLSAAVLAKLVLTTRG